MKTPRPLQQAAVDEIVQHMRSKSTGTDPIVLEASVGAGKSLMLAMLAGHVTKNNGRVMMLARQAELIEQNSAEAIEIGVNNSIFCASLNNLKSTFYPAVYGTEGSIYRALDKEFDGIKIDLLLIDECHQVPFDNPDTMMMKIIYELQRRNPKIRICGMTGSPYRGMNSIIGQFWKKSTVTDMSTTTQVDNGYLLESHFSFPDSETEEIDFSQFEVRGEHSGNDYKEEDINRIYQGEVHKTFGICSDIVRRTENSNGVLIFAGSKLHTEQIKHGLEIAGVPADAIRIVTDDTGTKDRLEARRAAMSQKCKYFINIAVASTGWSVPPWSDIVYMRPVGSLVFLTQSIGRGLRPFLDGDEATEFNSPDTTPEQRKAILAGSRKPFCSVHDYAGVFDRLGHLYNSPMLEQAALEKSKREGKLIDCPACMTQNSEHARRCVGHDMASPDGRCEHFWSSQGCRKCGALNDVTAQECRSCKAMLRDPANALMNKAYSDSELTAVSKMTVTATKNDGVLVKYIVDRPHEELGHPTEFYSLKSDAGKRIWFNRFLKIHIRDPGWRNRAYGMHAEACMKNQAIFDVPTHIAYRINDKKKFIIGNKKFRSGRIEDAEGAA